MRNPFFQWPIRSLALLLLVLAQPHFTTAGSFQAQLDRAGIAYRVPQSGKAKLVNIAAFELIAFQDGALVLRSRVIVGAPWHPHRASAPMFQPCGSSYLAANLVNDCQW